MVRIDVFHTGKKYVFVPIYVRDTIKDSLPNKAVSALKPYDQWLKLSEKDHFLFSVYPGELIHIVSKKGIKPKFNNPENASRGPFTNVFVYYKNADIKTASITVDSPDNSYSARGIGIASLLKFEKYTVDYFGSIHKVNEKKRMGFKSKVR